MVLALAKFVLGVLSGSLVVLASAGDSFSDGLMSGFNWWGYHHARIPADEDHPYGHGKFEGAFAMGQGMLLLGVVASLLATCVLGLIQGRPAPEVDLAVATLIGSGVAAAGLTWTLSRPSAGRSVVLQADAAHYRIDMLTSLGAIAGLLLTGATGWPWLDPVVGIVMTLVMARECLRVLRQGAAELLDEALPPEERAEVERVLARNEARVIEFHGLRTRRSGPLRFVEVHAVLDAGLTLGEAHSLVQDIGRQVREVLPETRVLVHPDATGQEDAVDVHLEGEARRPAGEGGGPRPAPGGVAPAGEEAARAE